MKKIFFILILVLFPLFHFDNSSTCTCAEKLTAEKVINDLDTIKSKADTTFSTGKEIIDILSSEVKTYGLKKTIQANFSIFVPMFIFLVLFLLYLKGRRK